MNQQILDIFRLLSLIWYGNLQYRTVQNYKMHRSNDEYFTVLVLCYVFLRVIANKCFENGKSELH